MIGGESIIENPEDLEGVESTSTVKGDENELQVLNDTIIQMDSRGHLRFPIEIFSL